jgi:predicted Rossmann fold flavoprotein
MKKAEVIIIGGGAAGLMCAIEAGKRDRKVIILEHANKIGKKILMSGGGRCNFTNYNITPENYLSHNKHFCKSALSRYTQWDFIALVKKHHVPFHEKTLGQLFCDNKSKDILDMLLDECKQVGVAILLETQIKNLDKIVTDSHHNDANEKNNAQQNFIINTNKGDFQCQSLVVASGGLSIPTMGATPFGYKIAEQFGIKVWPTRAGLVPLTLHSNDKESLSALSGIAIDSLVKNKNKSFRENILFTHRGLSGPAILQISSYWHPGEEIIINLLPDTNLADQLKYLQQHASQKQLNSVLSELLTKRVIEVFVADDAARKKLQFLSHKDIEQIAAKFNAWHLKPNGTEGYRTAEVTLGGVDCHAISSKTMEAKNVRGLYFIGEVLDIAGWLGGFNFQWAWSSGWAAGQVV